MRQRLKIDVLKPNRNSPGSFSELYSNSIDVDDSIDFDYSALIKAFKLLYPFDGVTISFSIC